MKESVASRRDVCMRSIHPCHGRLESSGYHTEKQVSEERDAVGLNLAHSG